LGSLFGVPWTTPERGREFWSEEFRCRVTSKMYRPLIPGEVKDPSSRSNHGSNVWKIVGKWISSVNQMKRSESITAGAVHWGSKHIPVKNRAETPPRKRTGGFYNWGKAGNTAKMNRQIPRTVSVEEHEELVSTVQTLQLQLRALSTQVLSITEITIQHRSEQQRNRDECEALRQQIEELKFASGPVSPVTNTSLSDEASSPGPRLQLDLNLRPPTEADHTAPDQNRM
jgi:hypothetical protein